MSRRIFVIIQETDGDAYNKKLITTKHNFVHSEAVPVLHSGEPSLIISHNQAH